MARLLRGLNVSNPPGKSSRFAPVRSQTKATPKRVAFVVISRMRTLGFDP